MVIMYNYVGGYLGVVFGRSFGCNMNMLKSTKKYTHVKLKFCKNLTSLCHFYFTVI